MIGVAFLLIGAVALPGLVALIRYVRQEQREFDAGLAQQSVAVYSQAPGEQPRGYVPIQELEF